MVKGSFTAVKVITPIIFTVQDAASCVKNCWLFTPIPHFLLSMLTTILNISIVHFTVVCLVAWPMNESEAGVDLV